MRRSPSKTSSSRCATAAFSETAALLRLRGLDLDQHVPVLPVADVVQLVRNAGLAPQHLAGFFVRLAHASVVERHHVLALREWHDEIGQQVLMPRLSLVRIELHAPHAQKLVLEQDLVADRSKLARLRHRVPPYLPTILP